MIDIDAIEKRANAATKGPWMYDPKFGLTHKTGQATILLMSSTERYCFSFRDDADAEFVAHAREDVPALIAEVRRLREILYQRENYFFAATMALVCARDKELEEKRQGSKVVSFAEEKQKKAEKLERKKRARLIDMMCKAAKKLKWD